LSPNIAQERQAKEQALETIAQERKAKEEERKAKEQALEATAQEQKQTEQALTENAKLKALLKLHGIDASDAQNE